MRKNKLEIEVTLKPALLADKIKIYNWLARSNLTSEMLGYPKFPDNPVPTWEEFDEDYLDHYFNDSQPNAGRCYLIIHNDTEVGQINYNPIDGVTKTTELDIWLADKKFTCKGIGTAAIDILCKKLFAETECRMILIQPSARNLKAIHTYSKAGFELVNETPKGFKFDYFDSVVMAFSRTN